MRKHVAPILAVILLLLPLVYVGGYLALVVPGGILRFTGVTPVDPAGLITSTHRPIVVRYYRSGGQWEERVFWPLEQIDRRVRPDSWGDGFERIGIDFN